MLETAEALQDRPIGRRQGAAQSRGDRGEVDFRGDEHAYINVAAERGGTGAGPMRRQQAFRQQRIAEVQSTIFMSEQGTQDERGFRLDGAQLQCLERALETLHESLVPLSQVGQIPPYFYQRAGRLGVGEIRIENQRVAG